MMSAYGGDDDDRRVLSSPAELPCQNVPATTLVTYLTSLAVNICKFKTSFFPTQRRNATETIRLVGVILNFLQEIGDTPQQYSPGFSQLHFFLQKILFLLQDCTRQGAGIWMLVNSSDVASQFQILTRGLAIALHGIEAPRKVEESVKLLTEQKLELDPDDKRISEKALSIVSVFESVMYEPDLIDTEEVLDYIGIKTWTDCDKEIRFLEDEINFRWYERDKLRVSSLSGLRGLLCFCRVLIFEECETLKFENPTETICSKGRSRSRGLLETSLPDSNEEAHAMMHTSLYIGYRLEYGTEKQQNKAAYEMSLLSESSKFNANTLLAAGTVPHLLNLLSTTDKSMQENVFTALANLSYMSRAKDEIMAGSEGLKPIVRVLKEGLSPKSRAHAAALVGMLAEKITNHDEIIPCLMQLIKEGTSYEKSNSVLAISYLLHVGDENYERVVEVEVEGNNIVRLLLETLTLDEVKSNSLSVLSSLASHERVGRAVVLKEWVELQPVIIGILTSTKIVGRKELCTSILRSLCRSSGGGSEDVKRGLAREYKSVMPVLFSLYSDETNVLGFQAAALITILQDYILH